MNLRGNTIQLLTGEKKTKMWSSLFSVSDVLPLLFFKINGS